MLSLKQLIESQTRATCSCCSIIDHVLGSFSYRVTQRGILNVELSELIYCTRKITRIKISGHYQIKFCSFKKYTIDGYQKSLSEVP